MKELIGVERDTSHGISLYLRYSNEPVARTSTENETGTAMIDFDAAGELIGVELIDPEAPEIELLSKIAQRYRLSLRLLFAHT